MSEVEKVPETAETTTEEKAPALPTTQPPAETAEVSEPEVKPAEEPAKAEEAATEPTEEKATEEKEKKPSRLPKRPTFKWGKKRDEPPKEPEPPKDPKEDILGWVGQQIPAAVHKANYHVLDWAQSTAVEEADKQPLPGKDGLVTRNQFLAFVKESNLLPKLANKLQPGAVEVAVPEEGADAAKQKEVSTQNIQAFVDWAKNTLQLDDEKALTVADILEKGKAGYPAVFETLWNLGTKAQEKFSASGLDVDAVVNAASAAVRTNIIGQILAFFRRSRKAPVEEKKEETTNAPEGEVVEETIEKVDATPSSAAPAVAAN